MKKTLNDYYQAEMQLLNEATQNFAAAHPKHATRLNLDARGDRDPHIERLLEGSAHLNARVKQQIDLGVNHVSEALIRQVAPQYVTPYPAMTVIEYTSPENRLIKSQTLPAGIKLYSQPVGNEQTICEFTTTQGLTIYPLSLITIEKLAPHSLQLSFKFNDGVKPTSVQLQELTFFINGPADVAASWYYYLTNKISKISLKQENGDEQIIGGQQQLSGMNLKEFNGMLPPLPRQIKPLESLNDYFQFPERFWFVKLEPQYTTIQGQSFKINIEFSETLAETRVSPQLLKLHCVPASNVFTTTCEPIRYHQRHSEYPLVISRDQPASKSLLAVKQVIGIDKQSLDRIDLSDFHQISKANSVLCHYRLSQRRETENQVSSSFVFSGGMPNEMHISCEVYASNGDYPRQYLHAKSLYLKDDRVSAQLQATNLSKPSRFYASVFDSCHATNILSLINLKFQTLGDHTYLKQILHLHDWSKHSTAYIDAIETIQLKSFSRLCRGMISRGVTLTLTFQQVAFHSGPELYLFGTVLHHFFQHFAPLNTVVETTILMIPSGRRFEWK